MITRRRSGVGSAGALAFVLGSGFSAALFGAVVGTAEDLASVIALHGRPCGKVVDYKKSGENDYIARCASGDVYRVHVDAGGRVRVDKQN